MSTRENAMRMLKLVVGAALLMAVVAAGFAHADMNQAGTTAANFLSAGTGARILSMGGATLGVGDDIQASAWNPAALGWMGSTQMSLAHGGSGGDQTQDWLGAGGRLRGNTRWGAQGLYQGSGTFDARNASNVSIGTLDASSFALGVQLAHRYGENVTVGAGTKFVREMLGDVSGIGMTFDFGAQVHAGSFGFGAAATNFGGQMHYNNSIYQFPTNYGAGVSYAVANTGLTLALDANFPKAYASEVRFGSEYRWHDMVALRAGYRKVNSDVPEEPLTGPTFGFGAGRNGLWFDYGYLVSGGVGDSQHRLSLSFSPGSWGSGSHGAYGKNDTPTTPDQSLAAAADSPDGPPAPKKSSHAIEKPVEPTAAAVGEQASSVATKVAPAAPKTAPIAAPVADAPVKAAAIAAPVAVATPSKSTPAETVPTSKSTTTAPAPVTKSADPPATSAGKLAAVTPVVTPPADAAPKTATMAAASTQLAANESKVTTTVLSPPPPAAKVEAAPPAKLSAIAEQVGMVARPEKMQIKKGDTLASIGRRYGISAAAIMMENNLVSEEIKVGQWVKIPKR